MRLTGLPLKAYVAATLLCLMVASGIGMPLRVDRPAAAATPTTSTKEQLTIQPEGKDEDLVYHWEEPKYSHEQWRQMAGSAAFLIAVFIGSQMRAKTLREKSR